MKKLSKLMQIAGLNAAFSMHFTVKVGYKRQKAVIRCHLSASCFLHCHPLRE